MAATSMPQNGFLLGAHPETMDKPRDPVEEGMMRVISFIPETVRKHLIAAIGELVGTGSFLFVAFSGLQVAQMAREAQLLRGGYDVNAPDAPDAASLMFIALVFGFSLALNAWVFFRVSGGLFNPAVSLGLLLIGAIDWVRAIITTCAQLIGAIAAAGIVDVLFPGKLQVATTLGGGTSIARGVWIEAFLTAILVFTIFMLAAEKHKATFIAPVGIGLALFICQLSGVYFTGASLNPARSFGPCVVLGSFPGYFWIYVVGPYIGSLLATATYKLLKVLEYESVNPCQDSADVECGKAAAHADSPADAEAQKVEVNGAHSDHSNGASP